MASNGKASPSTDTAEVANGDKTSRRSTSLADHGEKIASKAKPRPGPRKVKPTKANREGVTNAFEEHGQIMRAEIRPYATQGGSGTFGRKWGKLKDDIKALRLAGK